MVYNPIVPSAGGGSSSGSSASPWSNSQFYISDTGTVSSTNNPFGGTNVPWLMDPETRREVFRGFGGNVDAYTAAAASAAKTFGLTAATPDTTTYGSSSTTTSSQVESSRRVWNLQQIEGMALNAAQQAIGRAFTKDEQKALLKALNAAERKHPTVTKSKSTTTASRSREVVKGTGKDRTSYSSGSSSTRGSSVTSGGVDEQQFAQDFAEQNPEYAGYQKAATYFDIMMNALRGSVGGGF